MPLNPEPIYLELDKKREIAFTVGSALVLRESGFDAKPMVERVERADGEKETYRVFPGSVAHHLAACLQREARRTGEILDLEWAKDILDTEVRLWEAALAIGHAVNRYYGIEQTSGGANPPRAKATR
jgi:hypothetical protein